MKVIGYSFEADQHCVQCTLKRHKEKPFALSDPLSYGPKLDENGLPYAAADSEGNAVHPMFSILSGDEHCSTFTQRDTTERKL